MVIINHKIMNNILSPIEINNFNLKFFQSKRGINMKKLILPLFVVFSTLSGQHDDPTVSLSVSDIDATLYYGESDTVEVVITNSGDSDISWSVEIIDSTSDISFID